MEDKGMVIIILPFLQNVELQQLEIFNSSLTKVYSKWVKDKRVGIQLPADVYACRLIYLDGTHDQKTFKIAEGENVNLRFSKDLHEDYFRSELDDALHYDAPIYLHDLHSSEGFHDSKTLDSENIFKVIGNRRKFNNHFRINTINKKKPVIWYCYENNSFLVNLPVNENIECKVYKNKGPAGFVHELVFELNLSNKEADAILKFMTSGDIDRAKTLATHLRLAEQLLHDKIKNPSFAALGGYFLLRTNKMEYLHNWPKNLSKWFRWLPDGLIIYATQMMRTGDLSNQQLEILFMKAFERGVPLFTEGLRLLYQGLMRLHYLKDGKDAKITNAFEQVQQWMSYCDQSSGFTILRFPNQKKNYQL